MISSRINKTNKKGEKSSEQDFLEKSFHELFIYNIVNMSNERPNTNKNEWEIILTRKGCINNEWQICHSLCDFCIQFLPFLKVNLILLT